jgi:hypothetical protein
MVHKTCQFFFMKIGDRGNVSFIENLYLYGEYYMSYTPCENNLLRIAGMNLDTHYITSQGNVKSRCRLGRFITTVTKNSGLSWLHAFFKYYFFNSDLSKTAATIKRMIVQSETNVDSIYNNAEKQELHRRVAEKFNEIVDRANAKKALQAQLTCKIIPEEKRAELPKTTPQEHPETTTTETTATTATTIAEATPAIVITAPTSPVVTTETEEELPVVITTDASIEAEEELDIGQQPPTDEVDPKELCEVIEEPASHPIQEGEQPKSLDQQDTEEASSSSEESQEPPVPTKVASNGNTKENGNTKDASTKDRKQVRFSIAPPSVPLMRQNQILQEAKKQQQRAPSPDQYDSGSDGEVETKPIARQPQPAKNKRLQPQRQPQRQPQSQSQQRQVRNNPKQKAAPATLAQQNRKKRRDIQTDETEY